MRALSRKLSSQYIQLREKLNTATHLEQSTEQKDNLLDVTMSYLGADKVDIFLVESEKYLRLAFQYVQSHSGYEYCLRAAFYSQAAFAFMKKYDLIIYSAAIVEQLKNIEQAFPRLAFNALPSVFAAVSAPEAKQDIVQDLHLNVSNKNQHTIQLLAIRQFAREQLKIYQPPADAKTLTAAAPQPLTMQGIYQAISQKIKELFITIISESVVQYKKLTGDSPPCDYAFIALGSLAREEITPYSDLEFGLLLEDKANKKINDENKIYFRNLCRLINFKLLALGETPANILNIPMPVVDGNAIANPILKGMCFDARVHGGHKNPLGKRNDTKPSEREETIFELIGTPNQLAYYQDEIHYNEKGKLKDEPFLASSLVQMSLIAGGKKGEFQLSSAYGQHLISEHREAVDYCLNDRVNQLWNSPVHLALYQTRTLELLLSDIERFRPKMGKMEEAGRSYSVKHDLLRIFDTICDHLALFFRLDERSSWDRIIALAKAVNGRPALFSATAKLHLLQAIDSATKCRLAAYLGLDEQFENAILTNDNQVAFKGHTSNKVFHLPTQTVFQIYYTLFPFWQAAKRFRDTRGNVNVFQDPMYKDFYDDSLFTQGQIKLLLEGQPQALKDFKQLIAQEEKSHDQKSVPIVNQSIAHAQLLQAAGKAACETKDLKQMPEGISYLENAIKIYEVYGNSHAAELNDCYLDLALALQAQQQTAQAKGYVDKARKAVLNSYGKTHPYSAHCDRVQWYLDQPPESLFTIRNRELTETWHLPPNNDQYFVGREKELAQLKERFKIMEASQRVVLSAVSGLGGIGKTQLGIQYIHHPEQSYSHRFWFRAETESVLLSDYIELARQFKISLEEKAPKSDVIKAVTRHLEKYTNWLAVFDNAGDYEQLKEFLPANGGHLIITTRRQEWHNVGLKIEVDIFSEAESIDCLQKIIQRKNQIKTEISFMRLLAKELGYLPLALAQAGAYIQQCGISVESYLNLYSQQSMLLLADETLPPYSAEIISSYDKKNDDDKQEKIKKTIATTWMISLNAIQREEEKVGEPKVSLLVLQAIAYLNPDNVSRNLLEQWMRFAELTNSSASTKIMLNNAIKRLLNYSMILANVSENTISIHRLLQTVIRHNNRDKLNTIKCLMKIFHEMFNYIKSDKKTWSPSSAIAAHIEAAINYEFDEILVKAQNEDNLKLIICQLLTKVSRFQRIHLGDINRANKTLSISNKIWERVSTDYAGSDICKFQICAETGIVQWQKGDHDKALQNIDDAINFFERSDSHINIFNLLELYYAKLMLYWAKNQHTMAFGLFEKAKVLQRKNPTIMDAPEVAQLYNAIGWIILDKGHIDKAKESFQQAQIIFSKLYGNNRLATNSSLVNQSLLKSDLKSNIEKTKAYYHPDMAETYNGLGWLEVYGYKGNLVCARQYFERAIEIRESFFKEKNVNVSHSYDGLGEVFFRQGNYIKAEEYFCESKNIRENHYGVKKFNQEMANSICYQGDICRINNKFDKAIELYEEAYLIYQKIYGEQHANIAILLFNLGCVYKACKNYKKAVDCFYRALLIYINICITTDDQLNLEDAQNINSQQMQIMFFEKNYEKIRRFAEKLNYKPIFEVLDIFQATHKDIVQQQVYSGSTLKLQFSQPVTDSKDNKSSLAYLAASSSAIFSSPATAVPANAQVLNQAITAAGSSPASVPDEDELKKAIQLSLS